jgi:hypothetical protein
VNKAFARNCTALATLRLSDVDAKHIHCAIDDRNNHTQQRQPDDARHSLSIESTMDESANALPHAPSLIASQILLHSIQLVRLRALLNTGTFADNDAGIIGDGGVNDDDALVNVQPDLLQLIDTRHFEYRLRRQQ